jgi:hypothetical protein
MDVRISGDSGLAAAPSWADPASASSGTGDFLVMESASLSLIYITVAGQIEAAEHNHGAEVYISNCILVGNPDQHTTLELRDAHVVVTRTNLGGRGLLSIGGRISVSNSQFSGTQRAARLELRDGSIVTFAQTDFMGFTGAADLEPGTLLNINGCTFSSEHTLQLGESNIAQLRCEVGSADRCEDGSQPASLCTVHLPCCSAWCPANGGG